MTSVLARVNGLVNPYLLILLSLNLIFFPSLIPLQQLYPNFGSKFFISLSNNHEYCSKQKFNKYLNHNLYYLLILLGLQQLNLLFL